MDVNIDTIELSTLHDADQCDDHQSKEDKDSSAKNCNCTQEQCLHQKIMDMDAIDPNDIRDDELLVENEDGELPLHLACKHEKNSGLVESLLARKTKQKEQLIAKNGIFGNTPLHVAAFLGKKLIVEAIMKSCDEELIKALLEEKNKLGDTPVHAAAAKDHHSILKLMYMKKSSNIKRGFILTLEGRFKGLPIHAACGYGHIESVKKLVRWGKSHQIFFEKGSVPANLPAFIKTTELVTMNKDQKEKYRETITKELNSESNDTVTQKELDHNHYTPLTRACHFGQAEIVRFLLQEGAIQHPLALIKAIDGLHHKCVELLVLDKSFPATEILNYSYLAFDGSHVPTTPFRELIKHMPDIAELVLDLECVKLEPFKVNSENFKIELYYNLVGSEEKWDLDKLIESNYSRSRSVKKKSAASNLHVNSKETHPLSLMVKHKREQLLTHPVVASLIHDKWMIYGAINIAHWLLYILMFLVMTHLLLFTLPHPNSDYCTQDNEASGMCLENMDCNDTLNRTVSDSQYIGYACLMLIYSLFRIVLEMLQLCFVVQGFMSRCKSGKGLHTIVLAFKQADYIWDLTNWIEVPLFVLSIIFSIVVLKMKNGGFCLLNWQWQMGAVILWFSWIELIFLSTQFKIIGVHALMFLKILKTLVKFIPLAFLLIIGFAFTFHFLLVQPHLMASPYSSGGYSLLKTLALTVGDLDTDSFFGFDIRGQAHDTNHIQYLGLSTFLWILSLIFMTILLSNLTIGLAVGDIQAIASKAIFKKLALQVNYLSSIERSTRLLSLCCKKLKKMQKGESNKFGKVFEPNTFHINKEVVLNELIYLIWGGVRYDSQESITRMISSVKRREEKQLQSNSSQHTK